MDDQFKRRFKRYFFTLMVLTFVFFAVVSAINIIVDPFGVFNLYVKEGFNKRKPAISYHIRLAKAHLVRQKKPQAVILGTSRVENGIDPDHPGWDKAYPRRYNLGMPGAHVQEQTRYFLHAHNASPIKEAVIALSFDSYNIYKRNKPDYDENRLVLHSKGAVWDKIGLWLADLGIVLSSDALKSSWDTIHKQKNEKATYYKPNGFRFYVNRKPKPLRNQVLLFLGYYMAESWKTFPQKKYDFTIDGKHSTFDYLAEVLEICRRDKIKVYLYFSPLHAYYQEGIRAIGLWNKYKEWKVELVKLVNKYNKINPDFTPIQIWDFGDYNTITTEELPPLDDVTYHSKWYMDGHHYYPLVGNMILDRLFDYHDPDRHVPEDFGVKLSMQNIFQHLKEADQKRDVYIKAHPGVIPEIKEAHRKYLNFEGRVFGK
jgi:hypothetical protein